MTRYYILRTLSNGTKALLCGATILNNDPIWTEVGEGTLQPFAFKDHDYARAILTIAKSKDRAKVPGIEATYELRTVEFDLS